jgi:hypothetical protein
MLAPLPPQERSHRAALLVMRTGGGAVLCPFFGKCDGLVIFDPAKDLHEFCANIKGTPEAICDLVLKTGVQRLVLGLIPGSAVRKLREAGVDIRLGSCACAVEDLATRFNELPPV